MSRMERYVDNDVKFKSRAEKNRDLYNNLGRLEKYTSISDVSKIEAKKNYQTREGYHKIKDYDIKIDKPLVRKELDDFNYLYNDTNKTYDINRVLEEAKDLREKDALEKRRKLNNEKYNILESSEEELAKFKEEAKLRHKPIENEKELEELINTITSKELRKQIDDATEKNSLLSDLMATSALEEVVEPIATKIDDTNITKKEENLDKKVTKLKEKELATEIDNSFYTKSLDLSKEDFDDDFEMVKSSKFVSFLKFIFSVILIGAVGFLVYYVITNF